MISTVIHCLILSSARSHSDQGMCLEWHCQQPRSFQLSWTFSIQDVRVCCEINPALVIYVYLCEIRLPHDIWSSNNNCPGHMVPVNLLMRFIPALIRSSGSLLSLFLCHMMAFPSRYGKCVFPDQHRIAVLSFCVDNRSLIWKYLQDGETLIWGCHLKRDH